MDQCRVLDYDDVHMLRVMAEENGEIYRDAPPKVVNEVVQAAKTVLEKGLRKYLIPKKKWNSLSGREKKKAGPEVFKRWCTRGDFAIHLRDFFSTSRGFSRVVCHEKGEVRVGQQRQVAKVVSKINRQGGMPEKCRLN